MRALRSAVGDIDQQTAAELLLQIGVPLLRVAVGISQLRKVGTSPQQGLRIARIASWRSDDPSRKRIRDRVSSAPCDRCRSGAIRGITSGHSGVDRTQYRCCITIDRIFVRAVIPGDVVRKPEYYVVGVKDRLPC